MKEGRMEVAEVSRDERGFRLVVVEVSIWI